MLMISTSELASRLYETWRGETPAASSARDQWPPNWDELGTRQQLIWYRVAERAAHEITTAARAV